MLRESIIGQRYFQWIEKGPVSFLQKLSLKPVHVSFWGAFVGLLTIPAYAHSLWLGSGSILAGFYEAILKDSGGSGPDILLGTILLLLGIGSHLTAWKRMSHLYRNLDRHIH